MNKNKALAKLKTLIRETVTTLMKEDEIEEMARIATKIKLGEPEKVAKAKEDLKNTWIIKMINHLEDNPEGATKIELATAGGKTKQQDVNPVINKLMAAGVFTQGDLVTPKKEKSANSGVRGRPLTNADERKGEEVVKAIVKKIKADETPREEYITWFSDKYGKEAYDELVSYVEDYKTTSTKEEANKVSDDMQSFLTKLGFEVRKRGRPIGSGETDEEEEDTDDVPEK